MSDILKQIAENLGATLTNGSYLNGIADFYGVDVTTSKDLMADILTEVGGDPSTSKDHLQAIVVALGGSSSSTDFMVSWLNLTGAAGAFEIRVVTDGGTFEAFNCLNQTINF